MIVMRNATRRIAITKIGKIIMTGEGETMTIAIVPMIARRPLDPTPVVPMTTTATAMTLIGAGTMIVTAVAITTMDQKETMMTGAAGNTDASRRLRAAFPPPLSSAKAHNRPCDCAAAPAARR